MLRVLLIIGAMALSLPLASRASAHGPETVEHASQFEDSALSVAQHEDGSSSSPANHGLCCGLFSCLPAVLTNTAAIAPSNGICWKTIWPIDSPSAAPALPAMPRPG
jgi:hypothetical protein